MFAADWKSDTQYARFLLRIPHGIRHRGEFDDAVSERQNINCTGGGVGVTTTQFPEEKNRFQRFNATARYIVDPYLVRKFGWAGEVAAKLRYTWERNQADNWAFDNMDTPTFRQRIRRPTSTGGPVTLPGRVQSQLHRPDHRRIAGIPLAAVRGGRMTGRYEERAMIVYRTFAISIFVAAGSQARLWRPTAPRRAARAAAPAPVAVLAEAPNGALGERSIARTGVPAASDVLGRCATPSML